MTQKAKCLEKIKDKHGNILQYKLMFVSGVIQTHPASFVKAKMDAGEWDVINLKFTSNGRLVDKTEDARPTPMPITKPKVVNPMQHVGEHAQGLVRNSQPQTPKQKHVVKEPFKPENMGSIYSKFEELIAETPDTPWKAARETDKMNWTRIIWKRWLQDNNTDIIFELKKVIKHADKTLPKHRYLVIGYGHYSIDKDKFVFEDTVDNVKYDYSMLCRAVKNYCDRHGRKVRQDIIEDWVLNLTAQAVDADIDDDIEEIVQSLMDESYID